MSVRPADFRAYVLNPAMAALVPAGVPRSAVADDLVFATIANESLVGRYLHQLAGPALGIGQIEPATEAALWSELTQPECTALLGMMTPEPVLTQLPYNLKLATAFVRLYYWHRPFALAPVATVGWLWDTYKQYYNTSKGDADMAEFVRNLGFTDIPH